MNILLDTFNKKKWHNVSQFCNTKTHPDKINYRKYIRGKKRCVICGAKIGKIACLRRSHAEMLIDDVFHSNSLLSILNNADAIKKKLNKENQKNKLGVK